MGSSLTDYVDFTDLDHPEMLLWKIKILQIFTNPYDDEVESNNKELLEAVRSSFDEVMKQHDLNYVQKGMFFVQEIYKRIERI